MNRRDALKTFALTTGALAVGGGALRLPEVAAQTGGTPGAPRDTVRGGAAPRDTARVAAAGPFTLPPLPYPADALEPHLDARTLQLHHDAHHAAYVNNLNQAVAGNAGLERMPLEAMLKSLGSLPSNLQNTIRNNGGGHYNHSLLWTSLSKDGPREPEGDLKAAVDATFGSFGQLEELLRQAGMTVFGSGWAWLSVDRAGALKLEYTQNQDSPLMNAQGRTPLLGIDVWEHAYYLKFQNRRAEYLAAFLEVVDWGVISKRFADAKQG